MMSCDVLPQLAGNLTQLGLFRKPINVHRSSRAREARLPSNVLPLHLKFRQPPLTAGPNI